MNWVEARQKAEKGEPIRRTGWPDKWFSLWRGVWWCMGKEYQRVVQANDYGPDEFLAFDWTTVPPALEKCPPPPLPPDPTGPPPPIEPPVEPAEDPPPNIPPSGYPGGGGGGGGGSSTNTNTDPEVPTPPPKPTCDMGSASVSLVLNCDGETQSLNASCTLSGASEGLYQVVFHAAGQTVMGDMIPETGTSVRSIQVGKEYKCRSVPVTAQISCRSGICRGQQTVASSSAVWCCDDPCPGVGSLSLKGKSKAASYSPPWCGHLPYGPVPEEGYKVRYKRKIEKTNYDGTYEESCHSDVGPTSCSNDHIEYRTDVYQVVDMRPSRDGDPWYNVDSRGCTSIYHSDMDPPSELLKCEGESDLSASASGPGGSRSSEMTLDSCTGETIYESCSDGSPYYCGCNCWSWPYGPPIVSRVSEPKPDDTETVKYFYWSAETINRADSSGSSSEYTRSFNSEELFEAVPRPTVKEALGEVDNRLKSTLTEGNSTTAELHVSDGSKTEAPYVTKRITKLSIVLPFSKSCFIGVKYRKVFYPYDPEKPVKYYGEQRFSYVFPNCESATHPATVTVDNFETLEITDENLVGVLAIEFISVECDIKKWMS